MTVPTYISDETPTPRETTTTEVTPETDQTFHYRSCWYPICFVQDLPKNKPYSFSLYEEPLVLFRNETGTLICLTNRCPHRAAKLSDGQIIDGKIECLYHGWQFGINGECLHIPQLAPDAKIPVNACVESFPVVQRQGMIWLWIGEAKKADERLIPIIPELDNPAFVSTDYIRELPYDQNYLIENFIDPAHVYISHDGSEANRQDAQPLEIEVLESCAMGIRGKFRGMLKVNGRYQRLDFIAPNLVHYRLSFAKPDWLAGLALYTVPLGRGRSRVILRRYRNFFTGQMKLKPRWLEHLRQNRVLEEDLPLILGQQTEIARLGKSLQEIFLPLKTSDVLVTEYRKWLDNFGASLPYYQGYNTTKNMSNGEYIPQSVESDRFSQHTVICSSCHRAYQITNRLKYTGVGVAIALFALAIVTDGEWREIVAVSGAGLAIVFAAITGKIERKFKDSYHRS
ncbi:MAG TPA: (2Fe-2S)-binding protein [Cyanobacteria bacterium UBA11149]|nr:(2Fe-2S)-binding protein [Cyanobacteria bacterium UBA11367]HBE57522.1 (2Fe-2S)-binding protein [Cyanobacteria bacterium UBA11366]HBK62570.1 (2Fe-2S)-binding protein [Cyanobacteria bacterium UBA11166]HBR74968.1 (2Fe-2S)-binding protein [Cyanobacteria bacterium UBA11159]HBS69592.1 (2Fe-2S)-binding protein [Cyanobacteria bacterium UBA11153]HBW89868.1 (2Fe-2S)-binding protein [Cyanobacteria bacterium UBA11149]HCA94812.1 (2Fe-2S)-binding protein [Cyanobacteria bacterium UBA9226]